MPFNQRFERAVRPGASRPTSYGRSTSSLDDYERTARSSVPVPPSYPCADFGWVSGSHSGRPRFPPRRNRFGRTCNLPRIGVGVRNNAALCLDRRPSTRSELAPTTAQLGIGMVLWSDSTVAAWAVRWFSPTSCTNTEHVDYRLCYCRRCFDGRGSVSSGSCLRRSSNQRLERAVRANEARCARTERSCRHLTAARAHR